MHRSTFRISNKNRFHPTKKQQKQTFFFFEINRRGAPLLRFIEEIKVTKSKKKITGDYQADKGWLGNILA